LTALYLHAFSLFFTPPAIRRKTTKTQYNRKGENNGNYEKSSTRKEGRNQEGCTQKSSYKEKITGPSFLQKRQGRLIDPAFFEYTKKNNRRP